MLKQWDHRKRRKTKQCWVVPSQIYCSLLKRLCTFLHNWLNLTMDRHFSQVHTGCWQFVNRAPHLFTKLCKHLMMEKKNKIQKTLVGWANVSSPFTLFWLCHHFITRYNLLAVSLPLKRHYCSYFFTPIWTSFKHWQNSQLLSFFPPFL